CRALSEANRPRFPPESPFGTSSLLLYLGCSPHNRYRQRGQLRCRTKRRESHHRDHYRDLLIDCLPVTVRNREKDRRAVRPYHCRGTGIGTKKHHPGHLAHPDLPEPVGIARSGTLCIVAEPGELLSDLEENPKKRKKELTQLSHASARCTLVIQRVAVQI